MGTPREGSELMAQVKFVSTFSIMPYLLVCLGIFHISYSLNSGAPFAIVLNENDRTFATHA